MCRVAVVVAKQPSKTRFSSEELSEMFKKSSHASVLERQMSAKFDNTTVTSHSIETHILLEGGLYLGRFLHRAFD